VRKIIIKIRNVSDIEALYGPFETSLDYECNEYQALVKS
jgi:hypothetical protein